MDLGTFNLSAPTLLGRKRSDSMQLKAMRNDKVAKKMMTMLAIMLHLMSTLIKVILLTNGATDGITRTTTTKRVSRKKMKLTQNRIAAVMVKNLQRMQFRKHIKPCLKNGLKCAN